MNMFRSFVLRNFALTGRKNRRSCSSGKIVVPANDLMMSIRQVRDYLIPVNKLGGQGRDLAGALDEAFASDKQMLYFPAGLCSRKIDGIIQDLPWKQIQDAGLKSRRRSPEW